MIVIVYRHKTASIHVEGPLTITEAAPLLRKGELTPSALLEQCFARIDIYEPAVKAWVYLDRERARQDAERLTDELRNGQDRGPLHGIPIGIKDIIDVFDMPTGCGSKLWANSYARKDAEVVARLRQAGAIILGKTVTTPYAYLDPPPTRNPWNLERTPGGSSSGSAAAVACGMCLAALSTQTGGSTTRPASYCGVCSLKPTHGCLSVDRVLPLAPSLDHIGIMANCVTDLRHVFRAAAGNQYSWRASEGIDSDIFQPLKGLFESMLPPVISFDYNDIVQHITKLNFTSESCAITPSNMFDELYVAYKCIIGTEAATYHADRQRRRSDEYGIKFAELIDDGLTHASLDYCKALTLKAELAEEFNSFVASERYIITPATPDVAPGIETTGDPIFNIPWSFLGMPTISMPVDTFEGMPFSIQLIGMKHREDNLLVAAERVERSINFRDNRLPPVPR